MRAWMLGTCLLAACSNLTADNGGVVSLEVQRPEPPTVEVGDTIQLSAVALDRNGEPVDANIVWRTSDTTLSVDSTTGLVTGLVANQTGRVQASETSLSSQPISLSVVAAADTLAVPADTLIVAAGVAASPAMAATILSRSDTAASGFVPAAGTRIVFAITEPAFADPAARTVELPGGVLVDTIPSDASGQALPDATVNRVAGTTAPDTVRVTVAALHRSGKSVAGSGQVIIVVFQ
ncbi:MAG TPA: hypothetical protein VFO96_02615 [Gemmatimonadales bacterium]|jgi:hypothetical protein|nr:hypothetical protein [Gemmatimonadales bacterium]